MMAGLMFLKLFTKNHLQDHLYRILTIIYKSKHLGPVETITFVTEKCNLTSISLTKPHYYETFSRAREEKYQKNAMTGQDLDNSLNCS